MPTHRHGNAYVTMVLEGAYVEYSADGPVHCEAGTVLIHPPYHAHRDRFGSHDVRTMNMVLAGVAAGSSLRVMRAKDVRTAEAIFAGDLELLDSLAPATPEAWAPLPGWQSAFVAELRQTTASIGDIAKRLGVSPEHASRALKQSHGMSPAALRREWRWRLALTLLGGDEPIAMVATGSGLADQSHLNRLCRMYADSTPAQLRRHIKSVQADTTRPLLV